MLNNIKKIELVVMPEINRLDFFKRQIHQNFDNTFVFPNTCTVEYSSSLVMPMPHEVFKDLNISGKFIVGHVGNLGKVHYTQNLLDVISELRNENILFLFIGNIEDEIYEKLIKLKNSLNNIIVSRAIPHNELVRIYPYINLGLILYRGVDFNNEFCAPNKIYEFWSFGVPVIAHKLKGLVTIYKNECQGKLLNFNDLSEIRENIKNFSLLDQKESKIDLINYFRQELEINYYLTLLFKKLKSHDD